MLRRPLALALFAAVLVATSLPALAGPSKPAPPQLVITSVLTDLGGPPCMLMIRGQNIGRRVGRKPLEVRLGDEPLDVITSGDTWIVADFDCATAPGDYLLTVSVDDFHLLTPA